MYENRQVSPHIKYVPRALKSYNRALFDNSFYQRHRHVRVWGDLSPIYVNIVNFSLEL